MVISLQGGNQPVINGATTPISRGELTPVTKLFSAIYKGPITPFVISFTHRFMPNVGK